LRLLAVHFVIGETEMKILLKLAVFLTAAILFVATANSLGGGVPAGVHYIGHEQVTTVMAKGGPIVSALFVSEGLSWTREVRAVGSEYPELAKAVIN